MSLFLNWNLQVLLKTIDSHATDISEPSNVTRLSRVIQEHRDEELKSKSRYPLINVNVPGCNAEGLGVFRLALWITCVFSANVR